MKFFFDENFSQYLVKGLNTLQEGRHDGNQLEFIPDILGRGVSDEEWIPWVADQSGIAFTQDTNIRRQRLQWQLCQKHGLSIVFVKPPKKGRYIYWDYVKWFVKDWDRLVRNLSIHPSSGGWEFRPNSLRPL